MGNEQIVREAISEAMEAVGGGVRLAILIGIPSQNVYAWRTKGHVPAKHVLRVESVSGVHRSRLDPVLYPASDYVNEKRRA